MRQHPSARWIFILVLSISPLAVAEDPILPEPFSRGEMEVGLGLGGAGMGDNFHLSTSGLFAYYVIDRLAPGIEISYAHTFGGDSFNRGAFKIEAEYPDTLLFLPFLKFVVLRSRSFAPYLIVAGGREVEWGSPGATSGFAVGGGAGAHVGLTEHLQVRISVLALHYWYDRLKVFRYDDRNIYEDDVGGQYYSSSDQLIDPLVDPVDPNIPYLELQNAAGQKFLCADVNSLCPQVNDEPDQKRKWYFPLVSIGAALVF